MTNLTTRSGLGVGVRGRLGMAMVLALVVVGVSVGPARAAFVYAGELAPSGFGPAEIVLPSGIAIDGDGLVYVSSYGGHRVQKFSQAGTLLRSWGTIGEADGAFTGPLGIAVHDGYVYVVDSGNHRVQKFTDEGTWVATWGGPDPGSAAGEFNAPAGIAVNPVTGRVYVGETGNDRVQVLDPNTGVSQLTWGSSMPGNGQFSHPDGIAIPDNGTEQVYVADYSYDRVKKFNFAGVLDQTWGQPGNGLGNLDGPSGIAADARSGHVYVTEADNDRVQKFDRTGAVGVNLGTFGTSGTGPGQFANPRGVATDNAGVVYVTDLDNDSVSRWVDDSVAPLARIDGAPGSVDAGTPALFAFSANQPNASLACSVDGAAFAACTSPLSVTGLSAGPHGVQVRATSSAGKSAAYSLAAHEFTVTATPGAPACADGLDNDGDGKLDLADPGCTAATDADERDGNPLPCDADPACQSPKISALKLARAGKGMRVRFALNTAATVRATLARCVETKRRSGHVVCKRWKTVTSRRLNATPGTTKFRLGAQRLRAGRYRVTVKPAQPNAKRATATLRIRRMG